MSVKDSDQVQADIKNRFEKETNKTFVDGSIIDLYNYAVSSEFGEAYAIIEKNKNPHIFSRLEGQELDDTGYMLNMPRESNESDSNYFYRLMNWTLSNESSNTAAIQNSVLNMKYASNVKYIPMTKGVGTGTAYIIPNSYEDDIKNAAIEEAKNKISNVATSGLEIDYIIPTLRPVKLMVYVETKNGDLDAIKTAIKSEILDYINGIAPGDYMEIGAINSIGIKTNLVTYFNTVAAYIDDKETLDTEVMQEVDTKLIFNGIEWVSK